MKRNSYIGTSISLNEVDYRRTEALKRKNVKIVEIYRAGLKSMERKKK